MALMHEEGAANRQISPTRNCNGDGGEGKDSTLVLFGIVKQLKKERDRVEQQLSGLNAALMTFANV